VKVSFTAGLFAAGFGKGKFKAGFTPDALVLEMPFVLGGSGDYILLDGKYITLKKAVREKQSAQPDAKICYHEMVDCPEEGFKVTKAWK
jgi:hypothetical protein